MNQICVNRVNNTRCELPAMGMSATPGLQRRKHMCVVIMRILVANCMECSDAVQKFPPRVPVVVDVEIPV